MKLIVKFNLVLSLVFAAAFLLAGSWARIAHTASAIRSSGAKNRESGNRRAESLMVVTKGSVGLAAGNGKDESGVQFPSGEDNS